MKFVLVLVVVAFFAAEATSHSIFEQEPENSDIMIAEESAVDSSKNQKYI